MIKTSHSCSSTIRIKTASTIRINKEDARAANTRGMNYASLGLHHASSRSLVGW